MSRRLPQRGFAMVSAIFLMVVLALLGGLMLSMSNSQQISGVRDLLGTRAYYAARAGVEWGAYRALRNGSCPPGAVAMPNATAATGFAVQVVCFATGPYFEGTASITLYQITATASAGTPGSHDYAERQLQATVSSP